MLPLPAVDTVISSTTPVAASVAPEFLPAAYLVLGVILGVLVVGFIISVFGKAIKSVVKRRKGR